MQVTDNASWPRIDIYSHHFTVSNVNDKVRRAVSEISRGLVEWGLVREPGRNGKPRFIRKPIRIYASAKGDRSEYRFHINQLAQFKSHLYAANQNPDEVTYVTHELYEPVPVEFKWNSPKEPRDVQIPVIEYLSSKSESAPKSRVITAYTGSGKGLMAMRSMLNLGVRTAVVVKAEYIDKWEEELDELLKLRKEDMVIVRGSKPLVSTMNLALAGELTAKIILISNKSIQMYIKEYERGGCFNDMYPVHPEDFYKVLGVGLRVIDEVHQDFHLNFKQDTYTHVPLSISMSATLDSDNELLNDMYRVMWPVNTRGPEIPYIPYIAASCLWYKAEKPDRIRHINAKKQYSHIDFENSILRNKGMLHNYLKIPEQVIRHRVEPLMEKGQKMVIFCSTIAMCTEVVEHLQSKFPKYTIARYVGEDDWENLHNNDIVVSTIQSAGTAVDIKNLRFTLLTVALSSKQTNIQVMGRLRKLKDWPDVTPEFMFTSCANIPKHVEYAEAKKMKLRGRVLHMGQSFLPIVV